MNREWVFDQWMQLTLLLMLWASGVWSWTLQDHHIGMLSVPVMWTILWAILQEGRMRARVDRWRWEQLARDCETARVEREAVNRKVEWFIRNNVTIDLVPIDEDDEDEESKLQ